MNAGVLAELEVDEVDDAGVDREVVHLLRLGEAPAERLVAEHGMAGSSARRT